VGGAVRASEAIQKKGLCFASLYIREGVGTFIEHRIKVLGSGGEREGLLKGSVEVQTDSEAMRGLQAESETRGLFEELFEDLKRAYYSPGRTKRITRGCTLRRGGEHLRIDHPRGRG
jgi:hypothetical protein